MTDHNNLIGAIAIHPTAYITSSDPGAVGADKMWIDTTTTASVWKRRNSTNTGWTVVGSALTTQGDIEYGATSGARTRLGIGSTRQVLTVVSGVPAWQAVQAEVGANLMLAQSCF